MRRLRHAQPSLWEGFLAEEVGELWEPWMREVDSVLEDDEVLSPSSKRRASGARKAAASAVIRRQPKLCCECLSLPKTHLPHT